MKFAAALVAALTVTAVPAVTHAAGDARDKTYAAAETFRIEPLPPPAAPAAEVAVENGRWYGWELILSDSLFLLLADDRGHETGLGRYGLTLGLLGVAVGAPALHWIHGNPRRAGFGLLVRGVTVALVSATILSPASGSSCSGEHGGCIGLETGDVVMMGLATASIVGALVYAFIDDFWFSRVPVPPAQQSRRKVAPTAFLRPGGGGISLAGMF